MQPRLLSPPHPPLLVLDLDETLVHSTSEPVESPDFSDGAYNTRLRPHLREFLQAVDPWWHLAIFTAAGQIYAQDMLAGIRAHTRFPLEPLFVFDRRRCTPRRDPETGDLHHLKDLEKVRRKGFNLERVLVLDDKPAGLQRQRGNLLTAPALEGDPLGYSRVSRKPMTSASAWSARMLGVTTSSHKRFWWTLKHERGHLDAYDDLPPAGSGGPRCSAPIPRVGPGPHCVETRIPPRPHLIASPIRAAAKGPRWGRDRNARVTSAMNADSCRHARGQWGFTV